LTKKIWCTDDTGRIFTEQKSAQLWTKDIRNMGPKFWNMEHSISPFWPKSQTLFDPNQIHAFFRLSAKRKSKLRSKTIVNTFTCIFSREKVCDKKAVVWLGSNKVCNLGQTWNMELLKKLIEKWSGIWSEKKLIEKVFFWLETLFWDFFWVKKNCEFVMIIPTQPY